ncbi:MAG: TrkH family potassium uptake protein [Bacteroidales bacterium]
MASRFREKINKKYPFIREKLRKYNIFTSKGIDRLRESINLVLYGHKEKLLYALRILSLIVSVLSLAAIIYYHGFPQTPYSQRLIQEFIYFSLFFYVGKFALKWFYDFHPLVFLKQNWFETLLVALITLLGLFTMLYGKDNVYEFFVLLGAKDIPQLFIIFFQFYIFIFIGAELVKASNYIDRLHIGPAGMMVSTFLIIIAGGTILLMLPEMTVNGDISFWDALFTSTSATCVTGLAVLDTATYFSFKGQLVIMVLIQLGGINILAFASFFVTLYGNGGGLRQQSLLKDLFSVSGLSDTRAILKEIVIYSFVIETVGTVLLFLSWLNTPYDHNVAGLGWAAIFHSVSAFNNAGFSIFPGGLMYDGIRYNLISHWVIMVLIVLGGLGFSVLQDVFSIKAIIQRKRQKWLRKKVQTRIVLAVTLWLIFVGAFLFLLIEHNKTMSDLSWPEKITMAFFQSITTRTAGFNTVDVGSLALPTLVLFMFLMYIGASPGGTGGGIKTTTFLVLFKSAVATIRGKKHIESFKHTLSFESVDKAYSVALFSMMLIFLATFLMTLSEPHFSLLSLLFEVISAFGTVGLSMGITPYLNDYSKLIITVLMFVGRIGTLTLAIAFLKKAKFSDYTYPKADIMIG